MLYSQINYPKNTKTKHLKLKFKLHYGSTTSLSNQRAHIRNVNRSMIFLTKSRRYTME